jgi:hypothetical protein
LERAMCLPEICGLGDTKDVNVIIRPIFKIMKTKEKQNFVEEN